MVSLFRRPKKPIRPRVIITESEVGDEEDDLEMYTHQNDYSGKEKNSTSSSKAAVDETQDVTKKTSSLLSFDDDLAEDNEDGEVFRVKKSSVSRRLMKRRDKEKREPRNSTSNKTGITTEIMSEELHVPATEKGKSNLTENLTQGEDLVRILNGREAEAIDMESGSEDDELGHSERPEYSKRTSRGARDALSDTLRRTLQKAQIPDANLVHEIRKRRQMARSLGGSSAPAFIPTGSTDSTDRYRKQKSRLIREDDHSEEDEEVRLDFSLAGNASVADREKRKEVFDAAQEDSVKSDSDSESEMGEWERQQLRKGVSTAQMNNVAIEAMHQKEFFDGGHGKQIPVDKDCDVIYQGTFAGKEEAETPASLSIGYGGQSGGLSIENIVNGVHKVAPEFILGKLTKRLEDLKLSQKDCETEISGLKSDLELAKLELVETKTAVPMLSSRFTMYQKLRGYVTDLVDCLRCKIPIIESLEHRMKRLMKARSDHLIERRRQDVKDQLEEVNTVLNILNGSVAPTPPTAGDAKSRRAAEREGRRTRRRRLRELKGVFQHNDGLSSDDEETQNEITSYRAQKDAIIRDASLIFEDVNPEFSNLEEILARFREWREADVAYQEAYTHLCIPKLIAQFVNLNILGWDPLTEDSDLTDFDWITCLIAYGASEDETIPAMILDPDSRTVPLVVEKVLLPAINSLVKVVWDPTSVRQTRRLVNLVKKLINDWSVGANSKSMHSLMCTIISKFKDTVDNDVFIPIFPKSAINNKCTPASVFSARQFWSSVKILDNISAWTGLLSDKPLQILALDALLTRYILLGIRTAVDLSEIAEKTNGVVTVLPRSWMSENENGEFPNGIQQLIRCLVFVVQNTDCSITTNRVAVPEIAKILRTIGAVSEAQIILSKYS